MVSRTKVRGLIKKIPGRSLQVELKKYFNLASIKKPMTLHWLSR